MAVVVKAKLFQQFAADCQVRAEHLDRMPLVKDILTELNDPYAASHRLAQLIAQLPPLEARCRREAKLKRAASADANLEYVLNIIGVRGIEVVLMDILEELTILNAELKG
jgi:hypothetical protein